MLAVWKKLRKEVVAFPVPEGRNRNNLPASLFNLVDWRARTGGADENHSVGILARSINGPLPSQRCHNLRKSALNIEHLQRGFGNGFENNGLAIIGPERRRRIWANGFCPLQRYQFPSVYRTQPIPGDFIRPS